MITVCFPQFYGRWYDIEHPFLTSPEWLSTVGGPGRVDRRMNKPCFVRVAEGPACSYSGVLYIDHHI